MRSVLSQPWSLNIGLFYSQTFQSPSGTCSNVDRAVSKVCLPQTKLMILKQQLYSRFSTDPPGLSCALSPRRQALSGRDFSAWHHGRGRSTESHVLKWCSNFNIFISILYCFPSASRNKVNITVLYINVPQTGLFVSEFICLIHFLQKRLSKMRLFTENAAHISINLHK